MNETKEKMSVWKLKELLNNPEVAVMYVSRSDKKSSWGSNPQVNMEYLKEDLKELTSMQKVKVTYAPKVEYEAYMNQLQKEHTEKTNEQKELAAKFNWESAKGTESKTHNSLTINTYVRITDKNNIKMSEWNGIRTYTQL